MPKRKVYYYSINLREVSSNLNENNKIKEIFEKIFNLNCTENDGIKNLILNSREDENHSTMDILFNDENYLFARVGKEKDIRDAVIRDKNTNAFEYVLDTTEVKDKTLEICTYFLLDYNNGLVGFIFGQSAPKVNSLVNIVNNYTEEYNMTIENIVGFQSVRLLLNPGSSVKKVNYTFKIPSPEVLSYIGLNPDSVDILGDSDIKEIQLSIKNTTRKNITGDPTIIEKLIKEFEKIVKKPNIEKLTFTGKTPNVANQDFNFDTQNLSYGVSISTTKVVDGKTQLLTNKDLTEEVLHKLRASYIENKSHLVQMANIEN